MREIPKLLKPSFLRKRESSFYVPSLAKRGRAGERAGFFGFAKKSISAKPKARPKRIRRRRFPPTRE